MITINGDLSMYTLSVISLKIPIISAHSFHSQQLMKFFVVFVMHHSSIFPSKEGEHREKEKQNQVMQAAILMAT